MNEYSARNELNSLPQEYSRNDAIRNNDVLFYPDENYNAKRFFEFLINAKNGVDDKIRITYFGIDGPPTISILENKDGRFFLTTDVSRYGAPPPFYFYEGASIYDELVYVESNSVQLHFYLKTKDIYDPKYDPQVFTYVIK